MEFRKRAVLVFVVVLIVSLIGAVSAEKLGIEIDNSYYPGDNVKFKIFLYDDSNNKIDGEINYIVQDFYSELVKEGRVNSGEEVSFTLPGDALNAWGVTASYGDIKVKELFKIEELEKADIRLEGDSLIITNIGNIPYDNDLIIYIGDSDQIARIHLEVGQTKKIRLTAPVGEYTVRVNTGKEEELVFQRVSLTGNVIGLERIVEGGFWKRYPLVSLFLVALGLAVIVILALKIQKKYLG